MTNTPSQLFEQRRFLVAVALATFAIGCDLPARPPLHPVSDSDGSSGKRSPVEVVEAPGTAFPGKWESWEAYFVRGEHVGYSRIVADSVDSSAPANVRYQVDNRLTVRRGSSSLIQRLSQTSTETDSGQLIEFQSALRVGPAVTRFSGTMEGEELAVETVRGSDRLTSRTPWKSTFRGLVAVEQSLRRSPIQMGQTRLLKMLTPIDYQVATVRLSCETEASVPMIDGKPMTLLEINCQSIVDDRVDHWVLWADDQGMIRRTYWPGFQMISYHTDGSSAIGDLEPAGDGAKTISFEVRGELKRAAESQRVAFKLTPSATAERSKREINIALAPGQFVRRLPDQSCQVLVSRRVEHVTKGFQTSQPAPEEGDRKPSVFVDFNSPMIRRIVGAALKGRTELADHQAALELTQAAHSLIHPKETHHGFSRASEIANLAEGDCTERAVLLAALLRVHEIPSRLAVGLVYQPGQRPSMEFHVWTLAYVDDRWLPLDATIGGIAPADRLTFATTNLSDGSEYDSFQPLLEEMGLFEIEIIGAQY